MRIEVDLNKRYLVFFGVIIVFSLMAGVLAAVGHRVSEINWQEQISGNITLSESLVAQRWVAAAGGFCIGTNCITNWNQIGGGQWTAVGGAISYAGNINVNGLCIGGNCITQIKSATQGCPSGQYVTGVNFKDQTVTCSGGAVCTSGATQCSGTTAYQTCSSSGTWNSPVSCSAGTTCSNGVCVASGGNIAGNIVWDKDLGYPYGGRFVFLSGNDLLVYPHLAVVNKQTGVITAQKAFPTCLAPTCAGGTGGQNKVMDIAFDGNYIYSVGANAGVRKIGAYSMASVKEVAAGDRFAVAVDDNYVYTSGSASGSFIQIYQAPFGATYSPIIEKRDKNSLAIIVTNPNIGAIAMALDADYIYTADAAGSTVNKLRKSDLGIEWTRSFSGTPYSISVDSATVCATGGLPGAVNRAPGWEIICWDKNTGATKMSSTIPVANTPGCTANCWGYGLAVAVNGNDVYTAGYGTFAGDLNHLNGALVKHDLQTGNLVWQKGYYDGAGNDVLVDGANLYTSFSKGIYYRSVKWS